MRAAILTTLALLITGCPSDRTAQKTLYGSTVDLPPALHAPAPPAIAIITGLRAPESVLHDPEQDVYFISNINGQMLSVDGNGFISRVNAETLNVELKWIEGGRNGVSLDAPKGMAILGDTLYVTDINKVRKFDRRSGASRGDIEIANATFLNDLTTDGKSLYLSDTGIISGPGITFYDSGTAAIWKLTGDRPEKLAGGEELRQPNGLDYVGGKLRVVTFRGNELYELDGAKRSNIVKMPAGQLDGVTHLADGTAIVSSWKGNEIYRAGKGENAKAILAGMDAAADLGYDVKRRRLLIPQPMANQVTIHSVQ
jgi:hypothetical protein